MRHALILPVGLAALALVALPAAAQGPCILEDNGSGTVDLPPDGCGYLTPTEVHELIDASELPVGTTIEFDASHQAFVCSQGGGGPTGYGGSCSVAVDPDDCEGPGPVPGTVVECFESELVVNVKGTGDLSGYNEQLVLPVFSEVLSDRGPGDPTPSFGTEMKTLGGELPPGASSVFCVLQIIAGTDATSGPNLGQVDLTDLGGGEFQLDSFFDIRYRFAYSGCPGSILDGIAGISDEQTIHVEAAALPEPVPALAPWSLTVLGVALASLGLFAVVRNRRA